MQAQQFAKTEARKQEARAAELKDLVSMMSQRSLEGRESLLVFSYLLMLKDKGGNGKTNLSEFITNRSSSFWLKSFLKQRPGKLDQRKQESNF